MSRIVPDSHPRKASLDRRYKLEEAASKGLLAGTAMIAHGRGEAFDYLLGEQTIPIADEATSQAAILLKSAVRPIISVNGNTSILAGEELIGCAAILSCPIEVNIFYRTPERISGLVTHLEYSKKIVSRTPPVGWNKSPEEWELAVNRVLILGGFADGVIPGLDGPRATCEVNGILAADTILVPLEDGDRCEALVNMGLKVIVVDLNPLSRSAMKSTIAIVDDVTRCSKNLQEKLLSFKNIKRIKWDNKKSLQAALDTINDRLKNLIE
jgi:4-phosphopantoate--beta-alanine ligase